MHVWVSHNLFLVMQGGTFTGLFVGYGVLVIDAEQIADLYDNGYYGKGVLSRSKPTFFVSGSNYRGMSAPYMLLLIIQGKGGNKFHIKSTEKQSQSRTQTTKDEDTIECLQLSLVESFWLAYGLGCLRIFNKSQNEVLICQWIPI